MLNADGHQSEHRYISRNGAPSTPLIQRIDKTPNGENINALNRRIVNLFTLSCADSLLWSGRAPLSCNRCSHSPYWSDNCNCIFEFLIILPFQFAIKMNKNITKIDFLSFQEINADSAQREYCTTFPCVCVSHRRDNSSFLNN